jgi:preprotein translocase subunit SecD
VARAAVKRLAWLLVIIIAFTGLIGLGQLLKAGASFVPGLALDLQGGTEIILSPVISNGKKVSTEQLNQAVSIIRQRVDSTGVSEAQINTSNTNIIVAIPGTPSESTLQLIRASAKLEFRPVLLTEQGISASVGASGSASAKASKAPSNPVATSSAKPTDGSDLNWVTPAIQAQYDALDCNTEFRKPGQVDDPTQPVVTCDTSKYYKYLLGPVEVAGTDISDATAGTVTTSTGASTNTWAVNLSFNDAGTSKFDKVTSRLYPLGTPRNQFAVTLDGYVITAPAVQAVISNGQAQITGNFNQASSKSLADQLKYGSLPISFQVQSQDNISATLGAQSLQSGLLAGLIGLLLVVIYSIIQYRGLAVVTIGSLAIAAVITYLVIAILSWRQGYRLSLSGIAGLIVSIGITADSFIVYFERVKDELREGRPLSAAVENGWSRAIRTILVSDGVNLLAATTLYVLTVGNVKGFAFTLGVTTLIDLLVVALFTHPILQLLARVRFFASGHKWSGFDSKVLNATSYVGRGQFRVAENLGAGRAAKASKEASKRQTIAERKAKEAADALNQEAGEN